MGEITVIHLPVDLGIAFALTLKCLIVKRGKPVK